MELIMMILLAVSLNGFLTVDGVDHQITSLDASKIIAKGFADYPFACITKCFMFIDGELKQATYKEPVENKVFYNIPVEEKTTLKIDTVTRDIFTQWWDDFFLHVRSNTDVNANLKIYDDNGLLVKEFNKKSIGNFAAFSFKVDLPEGKYNYEITAINGDQTVRDSSFFHVIVKHNTG